ncbi:unnamed protein product [Pelagomonas calceolata]|uniref:Ribulose-phosphate 3-epimerase n=1 Tax=Pelagomonas calceolata TaxID=35677 RepID=A0A8J2X3C8_9STRA|nr:unnamed protein product [Pelagomonas calceolata]
MQSLIVALALTASNALVAKTLPAARPRAARASVKMELIMPEKDFLIAPSILSADFAKLGAEVDASLAAGADVVHFDVMDNHYVPNLTIGPMVCSALRKHGVTAPIDVHLMVSPVDRIVQDFADAGASYITFHPEASPHAGCGVRCSTSRRWRRGPGTPSTRKNTGRPHAPAHPLDGLQVRPRLQPRDAPRHPQVRHGQGRHYSADVREPGLRRPGLHPGDARQGARGAEDDRRVRLRHPPRDRRRRLRREHQGGRRGGRRHVRRRLGHLPRPPDRGGLQKDDRRHARRARGGQGAGEQGRGLGLFPSSW